MGRRHGFGIDNRDPAGDHPDLDGFLRSREPSATGIELRTFDDAGPDSDSGKQEDHDDEKHGHEHQLGLDAKQGTNRSTGVTSAPEVQLLPGYLESSAVSVAVNGHVISLHGGGDTRGPGLALRGEAAVPTDATMLPSNGDGSDPGSSRSDLVKTASSNAASDLFAHDSFVIGGSSAMAAEGDELIMGGSPSDRSGRLADGVGALHAGAARGAGTRRSKGVGIMGRGMPNPPVGRSRRSSDPGCLVESGSESSAATAASWGRRSGESSVQIQSYWDAKEASTLPSDKMGARSRSQIGVKTSVSRTEVGDSSRAEDNVSDDDDDE